MGGKGPSICLWLSGTQKMRGSDIFEVLPSEGSRMADYFMSELCDRRDLCLFLPQVAI